MLRAAPALVFERLTGYPTWLQQRISHPVAWIGASLDALEHRWNRPEREPLARRGLGVLTVMLTGGAAAIVGTVLEARCGRGATGYGARLLLAHPGLAQRSLYEHVEAVLRPLEHGDIAEARRAVARIVGRDTTALDASGVAGAALESLAESFNDGVVAPALWLAAAGLPGLYAYKAVNTADSLIGHKEARWRAFGWAAARLDDAMNLVPARLAGGLLALAGGAGWRVMLRDAHHHASPNAGWPEAAMAGALGVRLGGPVAYDGVQTPRPWLGDGPPPGPEALKHGLRVYARACTLLSLALGLAELMTTRRSRR